MTSNAYKGEPFVPKKIIPVDLFPHTKHFELIILFERYSLKKALELDLIKDNVSSDITDKDENNQLTKTSEENGKDLEDLLTKREGFTSEIFKIEVKNLPKYFGVGRMKKFLGKMQLKFHKLRPCGHKATWMFINFKCEEDREEAIAKLDGHRLKGMNLRAYKANAAK